MLDIPVQHETMRFSYETASFVRDYLPRFRANFAQFCAEAEHAPELPMSTQLYAEKLYLAMFSQTEPQNSLMLDETIREFVLSTMDAEPVLLKAWMRMINDYVDVLEDSSASTSLLQELVNWIDRISMTLYHTYFSISQETEIDESKWTDEAMAMSVEIGRQFEELISSEGDNDVQVDVWAYYRGVPDHFKGQLISAGNGELQLEVNRFHLAVLSRLEHVMIGFPDGERRVLAQVKSVGRDDVVLCRFEQFKGQTDRREQIRVEPSQALDVMIQHASGNARGTVLDISENSVALYIRNTGVDISKPIRLKFDLPCQRAPNGIAAMQLLASTALIRSDQRGDPRAHVLVLEFELDNSLREQLSHYVANRQTEILKEIRHIMEGWT